MPKKNLFIAYDPGKLIRLTALAWIVTKLICSQLWLTERLFPLIPVHPVMLSFPSAIHSSLFYVSIGAMLVLLILPHKRIALFLIIVEIFSCLLDQNRWQPWEYQFIFMMVIFVLAKNEQDMRYSWQLILAGVYFFSGVGKMNRGFIHDTWNNLMLHRWLGVDHIGLSLTRFGYALPLIEALAGLALLFNRTKRLAIWVLFAMHLMILLMLGPLGLNINAVVWSWNLLMILLLFQLFYNGTIIYDTGLTKNRFKWVVILCWWVLPWFQLGGYWDKYLSAVLYSGGLEQLYICTDDPLAKKEMAMYMDKEFRIIPCAPVISVFRWGIKDMRTAPYPEPRIYNAIIAAWKKRYPGSINHFYLFKPGFAPTVKEVGIR